MILPSRCFILVIGDDGALLLPPRPLKDIGPIALADHSDEEAVRALELLRQNPETPILFLVDTHGQNLKLETLPPLSRLDRRKLVQRRLDQTFAHSRYKTSLVLDKNRALLWSLDDQSQLDLWIARLATLPNPKAGLASLPLECAGLLSKIRPDAAKGWAILLLWQRTGGFRQIVTHHGKLVFTRLAAQLPDHASAQSALAFLAVDVQATRGYLSRFGLPAEAPISLTAILPAEFVPSFKSLFDEASTLVLSPYEAALKCGLTPAFPPKEPFCDPLAACWVASRPQILRLLMTPQERQAHTSRLVRKAGLVLASLAFGVALIHSCLTLGSVLMLEGRARKLEKEVAGLRQELTQTQRNLAPATEPLGRLRLAVERKRLFDVPRQDDLDLLFPALDSAIAGMARARSLDWRQGVWRLDLRLSPPFAAQEAEAMTAQFDRIAMRLRDALEGYKVTIEKYPYPTLSSETISNANKQDAEPVARYLIEKAGS